MDAISIHAMEGDGTTVKVHLGHNQDPSVPQPSVCLIDGDSKQTDNQKDLIYRLPGESPESYIYNRVIEKLSDMAGELSVALLRSYEDHEKVSQIIKSVQNTNRDPHLLYSQVGKQIGFKPEARVKEAFINIWVRSYPDIVKSIVDPFRDKIPLETNNVEIKR